MVSIFLIFIQSWGRNDCNLVLEIFVAGTLSRTRWSSDVPAVIHLLNSLTVGSKPSQIIAITVKITS